MSNETLTARRNKPFVSSLRAWIGFLTRPRRSTFPDSFVRRYALWLMIAIILVAASMIALDQWTINAVAKLPAWVNRGFKQLTDFGRSSWFLVPLGSCILALAAISPFMDRIGRLVSAIIATRLSFLFAAIGLPDLFVTVAKHLIGRRRPSSLGPFVYDPFSWSSGIRKPSIRTCGNCLQCSCSIRPAFPSHTFSAVDLCYFDHGESRSYLSTLSRATSWPARSLVYLRAFRARLVCRTAIWVYTSSPVTEFARFRGPRSLG